MMFINYLLLLLVFSFASYSQTTYKEKESQWKSELFLTTEERGLYFDETAQAPTVLVALFVRNKEHTLPYFLNCIYNLNYPKHRIAFWIVSDHNSDNSVEVLEKWIKQVKDEYHEINLENPSSEWFYQGQVSNFDWTEARHIRMLKLRQQALHKARNKWADYILFIDADNILVNPNTLWHLMSNDVTIVAPMLGSTSAYSNFWCGQDEKGYYKRTDDYFPIKDREKLGVFAVPMVHSTFLIDLSKLDSLLLQFWPLRKDYHLDIDDIIVFSIHAKLAGVLMHVDNMNVYGFLPIPMKSHQTMVEEVETFEHLLMEVMTEPPVGIGIEVHPVGFLLGEPTYSKLGFDEIYMINLERRPDRYYRMKAVLDLQHIAFKQFRAIDSKKLNTTYLVEKGIDMLPGFVDPYRQRTLTRGEIGCFLSHYFIWEEIVEKGYQQTIVLEDDIRFENGFSRRLTAAMEEIKTMGIEWDLIYIGRKRMQTKVPEKQVDGSEHLVEADYSFWTLGYLISVSGARKLLAAKPLGKMVPVDEYLPIMFNKHPIQKYMDHFPIRNVIALSVEPLLVYPTHYTGQINYFSDTETSTIWEEVAKKEEL